MVNVEMFLDKSVEQNASLYFDKSKKLKKKVVGAKEAVAIYEKKLEKLEKKKNAEKEEYDQIKSVKEVNKQSNPQFWPRIRMTSIHTCDRPP